MDVYKTPVAELIDDNNRPYKPVKGILIGLSYTLILASIVSMTWLVACAFVLGFDLTSPTIETELAGNRFYMLSDTLVSALVLFFGGRAIGKQTPGKELKFGFILAFITIVLFLLLMLVTDSFKIYPLYYILLTLVTTAVVIPYGSKTAAGS